MAVIAFKIFLTCLLIFIASVIIEDATKPMGIPLLWVKIIGGLAVMVGFVNLIASILLFIWGV